MKKTLLFLFLLAFTSLKAQISWQGGTTPDENDSATILFDKTGTGLASYSGTIYAHTGVTLDDTDQWQNVIGTWGSNTTQPALTLVSGNIYELDLTPTIRAFYNNPTGSITSINIVLRSDDGSQQTIDFEISVGAFQVTMINPAPSANGVVIVDNGGGTQILAQNSNGPANYELFANGASIHSQNNTTFYNGYLFSGLTENQYCELVVTQGAETTSRSFLILVNSTSEESIPSNLEDGINYNDSDPTTATLVIDAPNKDFVYVAGSFNNWEPTSTHAMKKDPSSSKFWVELTGLTSGQIETYQYWVGSLNPIAGSPKLVKTADPYSTLVLSPFDDPWISATTYPNLPAYPEGQEREVTVLETGQTPYAWQVTNFQKPKKEDLIIYEVLVRDFDQDRNFQDLIDKVDYFKDLNVNAIQLMPVMEFEGNESWGYNTSFHMALDKFYGTEEKLKELVDVFHQNGIAVILDIALNHAFGRNPMVRMWMDDPDGDGWGEPSSENPYFNQVAKHSYSVGSDFNHQQTRTQYYVERVVKHWIEEFNIDGFRWDLTKGFTQNCENSDTCTDAPQPDRIAILQQYADYSWSLDPDHYVIFEHLGNPAEEQQWANYRIDEGKGVMMWKEVWNDYKNLAQGNSANINAMGNTASGFTGKRALGYPESHDKDRIMYEMLQFGNSNGGYDVTNLNTALQRMSTIGAVSLTIPGPKMIWHFGELGMDVSIWTCNNGVVNSDYDGNNDGDCKLDTKPQPQWLNNWISDTNRSQIYNNWARLNELKINEDVFEGNYSIDSGDTTPRIYIWDDTLPSTSLKNVVILANFDVTAQNIVPDFPYTGTWYDLMDDSGNSTITVSSSTAAINIPAGEFRIYGNQASTLSVEDFSSLSTLKMFPNPTSNSFKTNKTLDKVLIYNTTGKLICTFDGGFEKNHEFNVSNLSQGLYMVKLESNSNTITRKLIIN